MLNTPYRPPDAVRPTERLRENPGTFQYQLYFQTPGVAEAELSANVRRALAIIFRGVQDDPAKDSLAVFSRAANGVLGDQVEAPTLLTPDELDIYEQAFTQGGFRGPLNWYRNIDRNWEETARCLAYDHRAGADGDRGERQRPASRLHHRDGGVGAASAARPDRALFALDAAGASR